MGQCLCLALSHNSSCTWIVTCSGSIGICFETLGGISSIQRYVQAVQLDSNPDCQLYVWHLYSPLISIAISLPCFFLSILFLGSHQRSCIAKLVAKEFYSYWSAGPRSRLCRTEQTCHRKNRKNHWRCCFVWVLCECPQWRSWVDICTGICLVIVQIPVETSLSEWAYGIPKAPVEPESSVIL